MANVMASVMMYSEDKPLRTKLVTCMQGALDSPQSWSCAAHRTVGEVPKASYIQYSSLLGRLFIHLLFIIIHSSMHLLVRPHAAATSCPQATLVLPGWLGLLI